MPCLCVSPPRGFSSPTKCRPHPSSLPACRICCLLTFVHLQTARFPRRYPRDWEKLHSIGVELKAHHRQCRLQSTPQAASLSSTLLLCRWFCVLVVSPGTSTLGRAAAGAAAFWVQKHHIQPEYGDKQAGVGRDRRTRLARPNSQARTQTGKHELSLFS